MRVSKKFFTGVYLALVLPDKDLEIYIVKLRGNNFGFYHGKFTSILTPFKLFSFFNLFGDLSQTFSSVYWLKLLHKKIHTMFFSFFL